MLDERVLFALDRARVRHEGRQIVRTLAALWRVHPEWTRIRIEGHCDVRGGDAWNLALSRMRAERVRDLLVREGFDPARIDAVGFGRLHPRAPGASERAHARNRRVEFVIERGGQP